MTNTIITVPDIGGAAAEVVEILIAVGDVIALEQSLIVLESDKASMEIPATTAGTVTELKIAVGDLLSEGDVILLVIADAASAAEDAPETTVSSAPEKAVAPISPEGETAVNVLDQAVAAPTEALVVTVPDIGTDEAVEIVELCVAIGDQVNEGDSLLVLESDKASIEVPTPAGGKVIEWLVKTGDEVRQGSPIAKLSGVTLNAPVAPVTPSAAALVSTEAPVAMQPAAKAPPIIAHVKTDNTNAATASETDDSAAYAGPAVRKLAREFGVALVKVAGSGPRGRILKEDLHVFVQRTLTESAAGANIQGAGIPPIPDVDFAKFGDIDPQPRSRIDKVTATNMSRNWLNVPHVTQFDDADITELEAFRQQMKAEAERRNTKLTPMPFILKACAVALNANPKLKSALSDNGDTLVYKSYCHIGIAVDTPAGLVVPVLRDVDKKSIWEISAEVAELAALARDKKLKPGQMQGAVFTISSLGNIGGRGFTPIVNAPEVAILGVSRADIQPVWNGTEFGPRKMLPLSLSYDHRVVNGGDAGRFLTLLVALLSDIRQMVM